MPPSAGAPVTRRSGTENLPDLLLIERSRAGDEAAIEALIRRYAPRCSAWPAAWSPMTTAPKRCVQEAYLAAFGDLTRYEPTGKFAAWLTRLAYQQARQRSARGLRLRGSRHGAAAAANEAEDAQERRELEHAIGCLPEVFRTVFVLRVVEGISGIETAASLGVHETTVRTRLYRAHRRLDAETVRRVRSTSGAARAARGAPGAGARTGARPPAARHRCWRTACPLLT